MRWGINDDSSKQNITVQMCLDEIRKAQSESFSINFVVIRNKLKNFDFKFSAYFTF